MGQFTNISWTDHTGNPWIGCTKVSDGCKNCYAEVYGDRFGVKWGPLGIRRKTVTFWKDVLKWNKQQWVECPDCHWRGSVLAARGAMFCPDCASSPIVKPTRQRVFCASLADVFEDNDQLTEWRKDLFNLIDQCTNLDWLLLTKRPENILKMVSANWKHEDNSNIRIDAWPHHVWIGTTCENQEMADKRIPELLKIPAKIRFLSCEPLLGPVNLWPWLNDPSTYIVQGNHATGQYPVGKYAGPSPIRWVIAGGESGPNARPMHPGWVRSLRDQCVAADVPFLFKQWGEFHPVVFDMGDGDIGVLPSGLLDCDVKPKAIAFDGEMERIGKIAAGCQLDGQFWHQFPKESSEK
jgi:protein gp37